MPVGCVVHCVRGAGRPGDGGGGPCVRLGLCKGVRRCGDGVVRCAVVADAHRSYPPGKQAPYLGEVNGGTAPSRTCPRIGYVSSFGFLYISSCFVVLPRTAGKLISRRHLPALPPGPTAA